MASDINNFENDYVTDWVYDLRHAKDISIIENIFKEVLETKGRLLEEKPATLGIAAAEIVAVMKGHPTLDTPAAVEDFISRVGKPPSKELVQNALKVIERVKDGSALQELWDERENGDEWRESLSDLEDRLGDEE